MRAQRSRTKATPKVRPGSIRRRDGIPPLQVSVAEFCAAPFDNATRFELRVWDADLDELAAQVARDGRSRRRQTLLDHYLVSPDPDLCVKVRRGRLKVKRVVQRPAGLTGWSDARRYALGRPTPPGAAHGPDCQAHVGGSWGLVSEALCWSLVSVAKERELARIDGTVVEATTLAVLGGPKLRTAAVEGEDVESWR
jgi:hypothetical protein